MKIPLGIEGDYIETKENSLIFDVKGLIHPNDRKICFLRFFPSKNGERIKEGVKYKKVYDLNERYKIIRSRYPEHLFYSPQFDMELQCVKNEDIKKIYSPRDFFNGLQNKIKLSNIENKSKEICELLISQGNVPKNHIGITGSPMIGLNTKYSDIDVIIYGTETSKEFQKNLTQILKNFKPIRMYTIKEFKKHYKWRAGGSNITFEEFMRSEKRKLHQGKFFDRDFFIRYIKSPTDWSGTYYDYKFKNKGRISIKAEILDDQDAIFTPCTYKIKCLKILNNKSKINDNYYDISEVSSFRGRFCEQAKKGEKVFIQGKLEEVSFKGRLTHRIMLTEQRSDKMIVLI